MKLSILTLLLVLLFVQCKKEAIDNIGIATTTLVNCAEHEFSNYKSNIPTGKLPLPHLDPNASDEVAKQLQQQLFVINNFGQYLCGENPDFCYFYPGLDFSLRGGTPIYSIQNGIVRAQLGSEETIWRLVIEDLDNPDFAWMYSLIDDFTVTIGDTVRQGQCIGKVIGEGFGIFQLSREKLLPTKNWTDLLDFVAVYPHDFFVWNDQTPPIIETPFLFYNNDNDEQITTGQLDTLNGKVDIAVQMRDSGNYTSAGVASTSGFGNRHSVRNVSYRILRNGTSILERPSFDFSTFEIVHASLSQSPSIFAKMVYKHHLEYTNPNEINNFDRFAAAIIITNAPPNPNATINPFSARQHYWDTAETDVNGNPVFPNGLYEVEVTAWDASDNKTTVTEWVYVNN